MCSQVSRLQTGTDICKETYEKIKGELKNPVEEYALFWPEQKVWLPLDKQVGRTSIESESMAKLELRPKRRHLKLRFLDASSKLLVADVTQPVKDLVKDLCVQLRLEHPEEMSLVVAADYAVTKHHPAKSKMKLLDSSSPSLARKVTATRTAKGTAATKDLSSSSPPPLSPSMRRRAHRPGSASKRWSTSKAKKLSKKHQIRLDTPWLDPNKALAEQEVTKNDELILMYRFYYHLELERGSANVETLYKQARAFYLAGELLCSVNDMIRLSALLCQITKGQYTTQKYSPEFLLQIKGIIAPPKCKIKAIAKQITAEHAKLKTLSAADAKCWFVKLWSSLELFGFEFLSCTNIDTRDKGLIGVSKDRILFLFHKKKKNLYWDIDTLIHWKHDSARDTVSLTFSHDGSNQVLNLHLPDYSAVLVDCLQNHTDLSGAVPDISRASQEYQFDEELESSFSDFASPSLEDSQERRALKHLTYEDVYWASKIENPLLSEEERAALRKSSWENPAFENLDQLMDERFNFLDFTEYRAEASGSDPSTDSISSTTAICSGTSTGSKSNESSPAQSPRFPKRSLDLGNRSPLVTVSRSVENSPDRPRHDWSPRPRLTNGLLDSYLKGHSRTGSNVSGCSSDGSSSLKGESKE